MSCFCSKCGAVVQGKYCSCCGTKVVNDLDLFRREERRKRKEFMQGASDCFRHRLADRVSAEHLADACWYAASVKIGDHLGAANRPTPASWVGLNIRTSIAQKLFDGLITYLEEDYQWNLNFDALSSKELPNNKRP